MNEMTGEKSNQFDGIAEAVRRLLTACAVGSEALRCNE
jgi:hypothetical protein